MTTPIITFDSVSKRYRLRRNRSLRDIFLSTLGAFSRRRGPLRPGQFFALQEVSFAIHPGETVGLIGANGAGKSTTLKLIGRLMEPTQGRVNVRGRVAALLELGAGFHPELSGRDNVFLSGALAGLQRAELVRKFDSIVAFAELETFIDVPVKHYSSGMFARLAFAISAHLEPEILLVDEALAVGDYSFQRKCLDRIGELKQQGVTICLVSHAHDTIREHCARALWFDHGRLAADGPTESVVKQYLDRSLAVDAAQLAERGPGSAPRWGSHQVRITRVGFEDAAGAEQNLFETLQPWTIRIEYDAPEEVPPPVVGLALHRQDGVHVTGPNTGFAGFTLPPLHGRGAVIYTVPRLPLLEGLYSVSVAVHNAADTLMYDYHDRVYQFRVVNRGDRVRERYGLLTLAGEWGHVPDAR